MSDIENLKRLIWNKHNPGAAMIAQSIREALANEQRKQPDEFDLNTEIPEIFNPWTPEYLTNTETGKPIRRLH